MVALEGHLIYGLTYSKRVTTKCDFYWNMGEFAHIPSKELKWDILHR